MSRRHTLLLCLTLVISILWSSKAFAFAHPALPIPNARPDKRRFAPDRYDGGTSSSSRASTTTTSNAKGKSVPISGTPFRGISRRFTTSPSSSDAESLPPSQIESIVANAKSLSKGLGKKMDLTNHCVTAMTAGLAVSLAMVPEAVSFSCKYNKVMMSCIHVMMF